jgi:hypothetical protein
MDTLSDTPAAAANAVGNSPLFLPAPEFKCSGVLQRGRHLAAASWILPQPGYSAKLTAMRTLFATLASLALE